MCVLLQPLVECKLQEGWHCLIFVLAFQHLASYLGLTGLLNTCSLTASLIIKVLHPWQWDQIHIVTSYCCQKMWDFSLFPACVSLQLLVTCTQFGRLFLSRLIQSNTFNRIWIFKINKSSSNFKANTCHLAVAFKQL